VVAFFNFQSSKWKVFNWLIRDWSLPVRVVAQRNRVGQQGLKADVGGFRHFEREFKARGGYDRTAATADRPTGAVHVADVLERESGGESEWKGM
jgi:hypothetical protein